LFKGDFWDKSIATKESILYSGFSAQQVDSVAKSVGYNFAGVVRPQNDTTDTYGLSYSDFVVPLVKAVQELSAKVDLLQQENTQLKALIKK
jgi:hypothetical protein